MRSIPRSTLIAMLALTLFLAAGLVSPAPGFAAAPAIDVKFQGSRIVVTSSEPITRYTVGLCAGMQPEVKLSGPERRSLTLGPFAGGVSTIAVTSGSTMAAYSAPTPCGARTSHAARESAALGAANPLPAADPAAVRRPAAQNDDIFSNLADQAQAPTGTELIIGALLLLVSGALLGRLVPAQRLGRRRRRPFP